jgi:hypothetical protein
VQDDDIDQKESAPLEVIFQYNQGGDGPNPDSLMFAMTESVDEPWNIKCVDILFNKLRDMVKAMGDSFENVLEGQTEEYWKDLLVAKFQRLRVIWRKSQMRPGETEEQWEARIEKERVEAEKKARQLSRRLTVRFHVCVGESRTNTPGQKFRDRVDVVELVIKVKRASEDADVKVWEWIRNLLLHLKADNMSSDETDVGEGKTIYRVKIMPWRRKGVVEVMDLIDAQKLRNAEIWKQRGAKPLTRLRGNAANLISTRRHVDKLPRALYEAEWLNVPSNSVMVNVSKEEFAWVQVLVRNLAPGR